MSQQKLFAMGQIKELEFLLGKTIRVKNCIQVRYDEKKTQMADMVGVPTFIGSNDLLNIPLQVVIDRTPVRIDSLTQIEVVE